MPDDIRCGSIVKIIEHNDDMHRYRVNRMWDVGGTEYADLDPLDGGPYGFMPRIYLRIDPFSDAVQQVLDQ